MGNKHQEYELAIRIAGEVEKSFYNSTKLTRKELADMAKRAAEASATTSAAFLNGVKDSEPAFRQLERVSDATFGAIASAATATAAAVSTIATASMAVGMNFEEQMSTVQAISMSSNEELGLLREEAKALGKEIKFSAAEVGQGFEYMAMAGWKTQDMLEGIEGVLSLAAASGEELGTVSDIVTDAMTAFGLGAGEVNQFADVLAVAASSSNTNVSMMGETFKYVAPLAGVLKYTAEDTAVAIGLMANSGIKASQAGTVLRSMLSRLTKPTNEVKQAMDILNLSLTDESGEMKSLLQLQKDIREGFQGMDPAQASEVASMLAGQEAMSGLLAIANASEEDFEKLTNAINNSAGAAEKMADIRIDNLKGDLTILRSAAEGFGIEMYEVTSGPAREAAQYVTNFLGDLTEAASTKLPTARRKIAQFAEGISELAEPVLNLGKWLLDNPGAIAGPIAGIGTAITAYKAASGVASLAGAMSAMGPAGWAIMGLGGVAAVITGIGVSIKKSAAEAKRANLQSHFGNISLSMQEIQETASLIVQSESLDKVRESMAAMGELDGISQDISSAAEALNKMNWKVSMGMELSEQDAQSYQSEVDSFIHSVQDYVTQDQYAVSLSVSTLLGEGLESSNVVTQLNEFYAGKQQELAQIGSELSETVTAAFEDGLLDIDEAKKITELQQKMANIKNAMASSNFESGLDLIEMKYEGQSLDADSFMNVQAELREQVSQAMVDYDEAYIASMSKYRMMLAEGEENGGWSQEEYDAAVEELKAGYLQQKSDLQVRAAQFQTDVIMQSYGDELGSMMEQINLGETWDQLGAMLEHVAAGGPNVHLDLFMDEFMDSLEIDQATKSAMADLYEQMKPELDQMQETARQYEEAGKEIPDSVRQGIIDMGTIGALSGDVDAMWIVLGDAAESQEYQDVIKTIEANGGYIPETLAHGIAGKQQVIDDAVRQSARDTQEAYNRFFGNGGIKVSLPVNVLQNGISTTKEKLPGHKDGGIFDRPHISWFAEEGMEAAIPIDGSKNAIDLWLKTGELLGMDGLTGGPEPISADIEEAAYMGAGETVIQIDNSRVLQFNGNAPSREELESILDDEDEKFARLMERYQANGRRSRFW